MLELPKYEWAISIAFDGLISPLVGAETPIEPKAIIKLTNVNINKQNMDAISRK